MRRSILVALFTIGLVTAAVVGFRLCSQIAADTEPEPTSTASTALPITEVVLFSSGVGYFERTGNVHGNAQVDLSFPVNDINDLLKSLVLQDLGGGHISAVSCDSQAPVEKTLRSFAINLTDNPSLAQILNQARGEKVEVVLQPGAGQPGTLTGVVMGVERKRETAGKETLDCDFVNLWCAEGMRGVRLGDVQNIRFLNPVVDSEVKKALEVLAQSRDTQKKAVSLSFAGEGQRSVKVGYVVENPIWKTSYRLVLDKTGKPVLQGWAVVENTQDEDWNNVRMTLVSGRPISFQMDLYQPRFVARPVVEPELFASLRPPTYNGNLQPDVVRQVKALLEEYRLLEKSGRYLEAEACALKARDLDPDSPMIDVLIYTARIKGHQQGSLTGKTDRDKFFASGLNEAEEPGPYVTSDEPMNFRHDKDWGKRMQNRKGSENILVQRLSEKELEIERKLNSRINLEFRDTSLKQAVDDLRVLAGMNIMIDQPALEKEGVSTDRPLTMKLENVPLKSALNLLLRNTGLTYIIKDEVLQITTVSAVRARSVQNAASGADLGDYFEYRIDLPVSLPRQKSALLPIVNQEVQATRVSIYNEATLAKYPLLGLRLKNTTKLHLVQGPITVFDNNSYAGDARILDLQPDEERLLSYAIDLGVEVEPAAREGKEHVGRVKIFKGVVQTTVAFRESKSYTVKNRTMHDRSVLIEHPYRPEFKLVKPENADERARDVYRFEVPVAAGKTVKRTIVEESEYRKETELSRMDEDAITLFLGQVPTSEPVKAALQQIVARKAKMGATQQEIARNERRLNEINEDQTRLRANLKEVPGSSAAYKRYLKKFDDQETEIEQLQKTIKQLREQAGQLLDEYLLFVAELNVE